MNRRQCLHLTIFILVILGSQLLVSAQMEKSRVATLAIDPVSTDTIYAGTRGAGVFKSTDGGGEWREANNGFPGPGFIDRRITALAIDPQSTETIYAGTQGSSYTTTNGGNLWTRLTGISGTFTYGIAVDPADPSTLYTGLGAFSAPGETGPALIKSTNGGTSWRRLIRLFPVTAMAIDPTETSTIYAGTGLPARVFKSVDGGDTWNLNDQGIFGQRVNALAIDPESPEVIYAGIQEFFGRGVSKSTDGGATWSRANLQQDITSLAIDPQDSQVVYAGTRAAGVFKTENGGGSWRETNQGLTNRNINALVIDPKYPDILYVGTEGGGIFKSEDGGETWFPIGP